MIRRLTLIRPRFTLLHKPTSQLVLAFLFRPSSWSIAFRFFDFDAHRFRITRSSIVRSSPTKPLSRSCSRANVHMHPEQSRRRLHPFALVPFRFSSGRTTSLCLCVCVCERVEPSQTGYFCTFNRSHLHPTRTVLALHLDLAFNEIERFLLGLLRFATLGNFRSNIIIALSSLSRTHASTTQIP
jgi:hypothetical protein